eukprot:4831552-Karenia_brevis.AAC.1
MPPSGVGLAMPPSLSLSGPFPPNHRLAHEEEDGDSLMDEHHWICRQGSVMPILRSQAFSKKTAIRKQCSLLISSSKLDVVRQSTT